MYTQHGGVRPFGVALVIAGIDKSVPKLYMTEPSGQYMPYQAVAIGQGYYTATEFLEKNYKEDLTIEDTILLALKALSATLKPNEKLTPNTVEIGYASTQTGLFLKMTSEDKNMYLQKL